MPSIPWSVAPRHVILVALALLLATPAGGAWAQAVDEPVARVLDPSFRRLPTLPAEIFDVVTDPTSDQIVYVAGSVATRGPVIFRSTDGGLTWQERGQPAGGAASSLRLTVSPREPNVLYAAVGGVRSQPGTLRVSFDAGATWRVLLVADAISDILADPITPNAALAILGDPGFGERRLVQIRYDPTSTDVEIGSVVPLTVPDDLRDNLTHLAVDYRNSIIYAAGGTTILRSVTRGQNWERFSLAAGQGRLTALAVNPADASLMAALANGAAFPDSQVTVVGSANRGETWRQGFVSTEAIPPLTRLRFSPDGSRLAVLGTTFGEAVKSVLFTARGDASQWTLRASFTEQGHLPGAFGGLSAAAIRDDGALLVGSGRNGAFLTDPRAPAPGARVAPPTGPNPNVTYFPETGHNLAYGFRHYWEMNGGLAIFGYPITEEFEERSQQDGQVYTVQYFERARFEYHPEHRGTPYEVLLGLLGQQLAPVFTAPEGAFVPVDPFTSTPERRFFSETHHSLAYGFKTYWERHGGLPIFGFPISEEFREVNPIDGKEYTVQYFERARFEYHPEFAGTPYEVLLGQLGTQLARDRQLAP